MAKRSGIKSKGLGELDAQLRLLGKAMASEIVEDAARGSAEFLADALVKAAPSNPEARGASKDYGSLRSNIGVKYQKSSNSNVISYAVTTRRAFWGAFLEYGTRYIAARPWWRPTVDRMRPAVLAKQAQLIREKIALVMGAG